MWQRRRIGARTLGVLVGVLVLALTACAPESPVTEYTGANGSAVRVEWRDYPGHAYTDPDQVLQAPVAEKADDRARNVIRAIERRLTAEFGLEWEHGPGEEGLYPQEGNGYGGSSLYVTYNSAPRQSDGVPAFDDWERVLEVVDEVAPAYGFEPVRLEGVSVSGEESAVEPERADEDGVWQWSAAARAGGQWLDVSITDIERDPSGDAEKEMAGAIDAGWSGQSVSLSYGATTLHHRDRETFLERLQPFRGLERPAATTSD
ncbi:MAG TPA: hypothetical protein VIL55_08965 [Naasia sp.]